MAHACETHHQQRRVAERFRSEAPYWDAVYRGTDVFSRILQRRREVILRMIDQLSLSKNAHVLEVGCGAGLTTVELARRGYDIQAIDVAKEMLDLTLQHAAQANVSDRVFASIGDVHSLHFAENTFDLVLAVGVLPFLHSPATAMRQMTSVTKPGRYLIVTSDNYWRLNHLIDLYMNPLLGSLRYSAKRILSAVGLYNRPTRCAGQGPRVYMYSMKDLRAFVSSAQLEESKVVTIGFGPFTFLGKNILLDSAGVWLDARLQQLADRGFPPLSATGSQHILLARKVCAKSETPLGRATSPRCRMARASFGNRPMPLQLYLSNSE